MGRFYSTAKPIFIEDAVLRLPYEEILASMTGVNKGIDDNIKIQRALKDSLVAQGLAPDKGYINKTISEFEKKLDSVSQDIAKDPLNYQNNLSKLQDIEREITKEWKMGGIAQVENNLKLRNEFEKQYKEEALKKDGKFLQEDIDMALRKFDETFSDMGGTRYNKVLGTSNTYYTEGLNKYKDIQKTAEDLADKYYEESSTKNHVYIGNKWINKETVSKKYKSYNEIYEGVLSGLNNDPELNAYYSQMIKLGKYTPEDVLKMYDDTAKRVANKYGGLNYEDGIKDTKVNDWTMWEEKKQHDKNMENLKQKHRKEILELEKSTDILTQDIKTNPNPSNFNDLKEKLKLLQNDISEKIKELENAKKSGDKTLIEKLNGELTSLTNQYNLVNNINEKKNTLFRKEVLDDLNNSNSPLYKAKQDDISFIKKRLQIDKGLSAGIPDFRTKQQQEQDRFTKSPFLVYLEKNNLYKDLVKNNNNVNKKLNDYYNKYILERIQDNNVEDISTKKTKNRNWVGDATREYLGTNYDIDEEIAIKAKKFNNEYGEKASNSSAIYTQGIIVPDFNNSKSKNKQTQLIRNIFDVANYPIINDGKGEVRLNISGQDKSFDVQKLKKIMKTDEVSDIIENVTYQIDKETGSVLLWGNFTNEAKKHLSFKGIDPNKKIKFEINNTTGDEALARTLEETGNKDIEWLKKSPKEINRKNNIISVNEDILDKYEHTININGKMETFKVYKDENGILRVDYEGNILSHFKDRNGSYVDLNDPENIEYFFEQREKE